MALTWTTLINCPLHHCVCCFHNRTSYNSGLVNPWTNSLDCDRTRDSCTTFKHWGNMSLVFFNDHFYDGTAMQDMIKELTSGSYHPCTTTNIDLNVYSLIFMVVFPCLRRG